MSFVTRDRTLSARQVNVIGLGLIPLLASLVLIPYAITWHEWALSSFDWLFILLSLVPSILIHEGLHGLGYRIGGAGATDIQYGMVWRALTPYAHCQVPLSLNGYRFGVALPGLLLGVIPACIGVVFHNPTVTIFGMAMLMAAAGDLIMLGLLWHSPANARIQDHPSKPGYMMLLSGTD